MHVEHVGRALLHFRFPCLQDTQELTADEYGASGKLILTGISLNCSRKEGSGLTGY